MKRCWTALGTVVIAAVVCNPARADYPKKPTDTPRPPIGNNPHPLPLPPRAPAPTPSRPTGATTTPPTSTTYYPYYGTGNGYPYYIDNGYYPSSGPYYGYTGPIFLPGETLYGPEAVKRFMGINQGGYMPGYRASSGLSRARSDKYVDRPATKKERIARPVEKKTQPDEIKDDNERGTNPASIDLARRFIGFGDTRFAQQQYNDANERYRKAARAAPQLADAWFRQGLALAAMNRYDLAAAALKKGLELDPHWAQSEFRLTELYGDEEMAKKAHVDALAQAAEDDPKNADLYFLLGVHLHFDGAADRAQTFFKRAAQLSEGGEKPARLKAFLKD